MSVTRIGCLALCVFLLSSRAAHPKRVAIRIGMVEDRYNVTEIRPGGAFELKLPKTARGDYLFVSILVADDCEKRPYDFEVLANGVVITERGGETNGVGQRSFFVPLSDSGKKPVKIAIRNRAEEPLFLRSARVLRSFERYLCQPPEKDDFTLSLLVNHAKPEMRQFQEIAKLKRAPGVRIAFSSEVYYAAYNRDLLQSELNNMRACAEKHDLPFYALTVSWWGGTPPEVKERLDFQQICWSESDTYDEGEALKKLLGDKWDIRYGLTTPNVWSNCPWPTMNSPELNELRHRKMIEAVEMVGETMKGRLLGYISENEPAYWAGDNFPDQNYPVKRRNLWADFNPHTVEAAKAGGITLDPTNGLDLKERSWLLDNVTRYIQNNVRVLQAAGASGQLYSHHLLALMFPMIGTGHYRPYAETTRVVGARPGVETLWRTDMDGFRRIREWGNWAVVNREENDGMGLDYHTAMLQAAYMMGADMLNSYNWDAASIEYRTVTYFNEFLNRLAEGSNVVAGEKTGGTEWTPLTERRGSVSTRPAFPWCNMMELHVRPGVSRSPLIVRLTKGENGPTVAYCVVHPKDVNSSGPTRIDFGDLTQVEQGDSLWMQLHGGKGWEILEAGGSPDYRLLCDLRRERRRSGFVTAEAKR